MKACSLLGYLGLFFCLRLGAAAPGDDSPVPTTDRCLSPYFLVQGAAENMEAFPLRSTQVTAELVGPVAEVRVIQTYENRGATPIEATYVFPASTRAAVHGLTMTLGGRRVVATVKERLEAKKAYEQAKTEGKTASLLQEQRPNVFQMQLANILPGDVVAVELAYSELLVPSEGIYEWVFPTVVGPRYSRRPATVATPDEAWVANPYLRAEAPAPAALALQVRVAPGLPLQELVSPSHRVTIDFRAAGEAQVQLAADEASPANRDFLLRYRLAGDALATGLLVEQAEGANEGDFLLLLEPPPHPQPAQIPPRDFLLVLDVSGSMHGFPLATAKTLLGELVGQLRPEDRFNVLLFAGDSRVLAPASLPATPENLAAATAFLAQEQGGGGTELVAALRRALALPATEGAARIVAVVTDGYVDAEPELFDLVRANLGRSSLFAFGIGSAVNRHLIEGLARAGHGEPFVVTQPERAAAAAVAFRQMIAAPVLTGIQVGAEGVTVAQLTPAPVPDVLARRPVVVAGRWQGKPEGTLTVRGTSGGGAWHATLDFAKATRLQTPGLVARLVARARIAELDDLQGLKRDEARRQEIIRLGVTHNLLTRYTSFVAIDEVVRRDPKDALRPVAQPSTLPEGVSELAVGGDVATAPEPGTMLLLASGAMAVGASCWRARRQRRANAANA